MKIQEETILRLHIEYSNTKENNEREKVLALLDTRFGENNYRILRSGPKPIDIGKCDKKIGLMVVEGVI